jgi:predicted enzyme related to lactoylglutathione lyase
MTTTGLNVWYDLFTTDVQAAIRFYGAVIGWTTQLFAESDPKEPYTMWVAKSGPIGGIMNLPEDARKMGAPPHWLAYTTVADVDKTAARAQALGGQVYVGPFDVPTVGRVAVLADPQGAAFAIYKPAMDSQAPPDEPGQFSWAELNTTDYEAAWKFYSNLFGWKERSKMDMGPAGTYFMFHDPTEKTKGGMSNMASVMKVPPHWLHYITVSDMDETIERIKQYGGAVMNGPMPIPGDDVIAQCRDPQGAFFAVYAHGKKG